MIESLSKYKIKLTRINNNNKAIKTKVHCSHTCIINCIFCHATSCYTIKQYTLQQKKTYTDTCNTQ